LQISVNKISIKSIEDFRFEFLYFMPVEKINDDLKFTYTGAPVCIKKLHFKMH